MRHWFAPALSRRLLDARLGTLGELVEQCQRRGRGWWRSVPRIGAKAAGVVVQWLTQHQGQLGIELGQHVTSPASELRPAWFDIAPQSKPAPFELQRLRSDLDGSSGRNRAAFGVCSLSARNDHEAIAAWLRGKASNHTYRAYRKEAERILLWAVCERAKPLSSLLYEDCLAYVEFLAPQHLSALLP